MRVGGEYCSDYRQGPSIQDAIVGGAMVSNHNQNQTPGVEQGWTRSHHTGRFTHRKLISNSPRKNGSKKRAGVKTTYQRNAAFRRTLKFRFREGQWYYDSAN
jgi:hypothetical protein